MNYSTSPKQIGYHGTYPENVESIRVNNFFESEALTWLGVGVYFFVEGINTLPCSDYARLWAIDNCWDKSLQKYSREEFSVLEATIKINNNKMLDLTVGLGKKLFNEYREKTIRKFTKGGQELVGKFLDSDVLEEMRNDLEIDFVQSDLYIKFAVQRQKRLESIVPNVTVLVVRNPSTHIHKTTIKEIKKGSIS